MGRARTHRRAFPHVAAPGGARVEPESGKTRVLEILDLITPSAMLILSPSVAAIFRKLAQDQTRRLSTRWIHLHEAQHGNHQNEVRALLRMRATVEAHPFRAALARSMRCRTFRCSPLPPWPGSADCERVMTRSIVLRMRRRSAAEQIEAFASASTRSKGTRCATSWRHGPRCRSGCWRCMACAAGWRREQQARGLGAADSCR